MVKYLSDNRTDQRFQTILSRPQPFEAEVPEQRYAVDEVDLTPALNVVDAGARAYYAHQGQELERESMAISYDTYQANRAAQQARQTQASAKEKETGLKNTILNNYSQYINKGIEAYNQNPDKFTREQLERYVRDGRYVHLKNGGAIVNVNDLIGVEKNMGVTLTRDLMQEASAREEENLKAYDKSVKNSNRALMNEKLGTNAVTGKPNADKYDDAQIAAMASNFKRQYYGLNINAQSDKSIGLSSPSEATRTSIHQLAVGDLKVKKNNYEDRMSWAEVEADIAEEADSILQWATDNNMQITDHDALFMARQAAEEAGYFGDMNYADSMVSSALAVKKNLGQYATLDSSTELEISDNLRKIRNNQTIAAIASGAPVEAQDLIGLAIQEGSKLDDVIKNNETARKKYRQAIGNIQIVEGYTGTSAGDVHREVIRQTPDGQKQALAQAVYEQAENIYNSRSIFGKYAGPYGAGLALRSIHNEVTTVQDRDAKANNVTNTDTKQRIENTERLAIPAFQKWKDDGTVDMMSEEEQAQHYNDYFNDVMIDAGSRLETLRQGGWLDYIRFDPEQNKFVVVNVPKEKANEYGNLTGAETLWPQIDSLNKLFTNNVDYKGLFSSDKIKEILISGNSIKKLEPTDVIFKENSTNMFMQGKWEPSLAGAAAGALAGSTAGPVGALLGAGIGATGTTGLKTILETADAVTGGVTAIRELTRGNTQEAGAALANSLSTKAAMILGETAGKGFETMAEMVSEATQSTINAYDAIKKAVSADNISTIPPYNINIISRVLSGDNTVTPEEANAALVAYNQASISDKRKLDKEFNIGPFSENIESQLQEYIRKTPKKTRSS